MALLVQKYGGSSVANADMVRHVAGRIAKTQQAGNQVAVVVSAMGNTTDELTALAHEVAAQPDPRELDLLLSTGELVSCTLIAMALGDLGIAAVSLGGAQAGIRTDTAHGRASIIAFDPARVRRELEAGRVAVVAGFQGTTEEEDVTTLGRGGSDTTAVALAAALGADRCEIYTDVDGIFTADPRVVPEATKLDELGYEEMLELASYGTKMPPRSIELGAIYNVPILVASSMREVTGTLIHGGVAMELHNKVRGVTYEMDVARITVRGVPDRPGIAAALFGPLSDAQISVDTIVQNASADRLTDVSFTVEQVDVKRALAVVQTLAMEIGAAECVSNEDLGNVSIVGTGMQNAPGYASDMFRALSDAGVNIEMITTSQIRITCIVDRSQVHEAVRLLHKAFELDQEADPAS
jgi:aspartate kinase